MLHIEQNVPLAILIVALSSLLFATGATLQHLAIMDIADRDSDNPSMGAGQLLRMIRTPKWLLGLTVISIGAGAHIVGLLMAPVTVVQPVGILAVPWSVLMAAKIHKHRVSPQMWGGVAMTILGIVAFTFFSASKAAPDAQVNPLTVLIGCLVVYALGFAFDGVGLWGPGRMRSLMWATGGSFFYGLSSALIKSVSTMLKDPDFHANALFWVLVPFLIGSYVLGGISIQQGYATGPAEGVVASMTTTDPVVGVAFGLIILGEGVLITWPYAVGMVIGGAIAIAGVVVLSKYHPDAIDRRERAAARAALAGGTS